MGWDRTEMDGTGLDGRDGIRRDETDCMSVFEWHCNACRVFASCISIFNNTYDQCPMSFLAVYLPITTSSKRSQSIREKRRTEIKISIISRQGNSEVLSKRKFKTF